ncbi:hypothetical protein [Citreimonas salinaria]|uniref:Tetratricopeptide repeat-containing protein n=1 Tax=Citreimonas salinaria TaxID=321339 RepID=A0A1H3FE32_9RHOB|nr:hypothetical protein [Citreimonas salinaria]SDX89251.1 hypothetical protein SAMN05444340_101373 [Citreimonas salinaria]
MIRLLLLLLLMAGPATAQTVTVRSGEHGTFTRLAFDLPEGTRWTLEEGDGSASRRLTFDPAPGRIDTGGVFARIDRGRLADLSTFPGGGGVTLALACRCDVDSFMQGTRMLVLDIFESDSPVAEAVESGGQALQPSVILPAVPDTLTAVNLGAMPRIGPEPAPALVAFDPAQARRALQAPESASPSAAGLISDIAQAVAESAGAGVLELAETIDPVRETPERPAASGESDFNPSSTTRTIEEDRVRIGVEGCIPDARLIAGAGSGAPDIATAYSDRDQLLSELGRPSQEAVALQRDRLLAIGLGAEARALSGLIEHDNAPDRVKRALSYLVDGEPDPDGIFRNQLGCRNQAGLWALLTDGANTSGVDLDTDAIVQNFEMLPEALRRHLGAAMAEKLAKIGEPDTARMLISRLERTHGEKTDGLKVATAGLDLHDGDPAAAATAVRDVTTSDPEMLPDLASVRTDTAFAQDRAVDPETLDVAELLWRERRMHDDGPGATRTYVRALLTHSRFDEAIEVFRSDTLPANVSTGLQRDIAARLARDAQDVTFLKHMMPQASADLHPQDRALARPVAERLIASGLHEAALFHLQADARPPAVADRILMARALLSLDRYAEAEERIMGLDEPDARKLRAEIREAMGDYAYASNAFAALGESDAAQRAAWLGSAWSDLDETPDPLFAEAATLAATQPRPEQGTGRPELAEIDALVEDSAQVRATLDALLAHTSIGAGESPASSKN